MAGAFKLRWFQNGTFVPTPDAKVAFQLPQTLDGLLALPPDQLTLCDIGLMNLLCAEGLRGSEGLNVTKFTQLLDGIASRVEQETARHRYRYLEKPEDFGRSEATFQMLMLTMVLQEDLRIRYNPERITPVGVFEANDLFFANSADVFIHGLAGDQRMGTCSSLPVFYVAIGRRLGYPLQLVPTKNHLFVRWEGQGERFNVDATGRGFHRYDDDHYRRWPFPVSRDEEAEMGLLKSMTAAESLAAFLNLRGSCLMSMGRLDEAVAAHERAVELVPHGRMQQFMLAAARRDREARLRPQQVLLPNGQLVSANEAESEWSILQAMEAAANAKQTPWGMTGLTPEQQRVLPHEPNPLRGLTP